MFVLDNLDNPGVTIQGHNWQFFTDGVMGGFSEGSVKGLKQYVVLPSYKVKENDFIAKNLYRPLFNILFVCKLIEKVVLKLFTKHIR